MRRLIVCLCIAFLTILLASAQAQPPAGSDQIYQVRIRYSIEAERQQRYAFYKQMLGRLQAVGFQADPGRHGEEIYGDRLAGKIPARGIAALRSERFLRAAVLVPSNFQLPTEPDKTVLVRLDLTTILGEERQYEIAQQARGQLKKMGFQENEAHDHKNHTRLLGRLPAPALDALLSENIEVSLTRGQLVNTAPVKVALARLAIVIAEPAAPAADVALPGAAPAGKEYLDKISPDLKALLGKVPEADLEKLVRIELVLRGGSLQDRFAAELRSAGFITEGSYGPTVTGLASPAQLTVIASIPAVSTVRLPQTARPFAMPAGSDAALAVDFVPVGKENSPIVTTVAYRKPPGGNKVIIIGDDFRGYQSMIGSSLPKGTTLVDLTTELRPDLTAAPEAQGSGMGQSAQLAAAFLKTTNATEVILARIDPALPYQVAEIGEAILGQTWVTDAFTIRQNEMKIEEGRLQADRIDVMVLRKHILTEFGMDENTKAKREAYRKRQAEVDATEKAYFAKLRRFQDFVTSTHTLAGANTVCVALQWSNGHTDATGSAPRLRHLPQAALNRANWYQAVARRPGQVWTGLFRDANHDGAMEFTSDAKVARPDLAYLGWKDLGVGEAQLSLPENTVFEATLQWSEAHDARLAQEMQDLYRKPLANLAITLLKQRDPSGKALPEDAFEVVGRSPILADRVENGPRFSHYQTTLRFAVPAGGGRYAVRITGAAPTSTFPPGVEALTPERSELRPKLTLDVVDPVKRNQGRVVFQRYATGE